MRGQASGTDQATDEPLETSGGQDLELVRSDSIADECSATTGNASRRNILGSTGKHPVVRKVRTHMLPGVGATVSNGRGYPISPIAFRTTLQRVGAIDKCT